MNWLTNFVKPKLSSLVKRRNVPEKLWNNCVSCGNMIHHKDLKENLYVCVNCNYHFRMSAEDRIKLFFKDGDYSEIIPDKISDDPLKFTDKKKYKDRLKEYRKKTNRDDAFILIKGKIKDKEIISGIMNFEFMGGSMGRAVGGAIVKGAKIAIEKIDIPNINKNAKITKKIDRPATNNWQKKVADSKTVIPKSGCISIKDKSKKKKTNSKGK